MNIHALSKAAALVNQQRRPAPLFFTALHRSKERCRTKNGCSLCGRLAGWGRASDALTWISPGNYHKISSLCAATFLFAAGGDGVFIFVHRRRVNGIELDLDVSARAAASHSHSANRQRVFPGARSKCSWTLSFTAAFWLLSVFWQTQLLPSAQGN